ncbi:MAG: response regulator [Chitinophagales bacterium]|nr:response regulator [Chitinophagales bacterium]
MSGKINFIVIDDSKLDCFIAEKIIQNTGKAESVKVFQQATEALSYIKDTPPQADATTVVFCDIQMPVMNGFEFVENFEALSADVKANYHIYMLSSSINENDIAKVKGYSSVRHFLNKPLTNDTILAVLEEY